VPINDQIVISPDATRDRFTICGAPEELNKLTIVDMSGKQVYAYLCKNGENLHREFQVNLVRGVYDGTEQVIDLSER